MVNVKILSISYSILLDFINRLKMVAGQLGLSQLGPVYFQNVYGICFVFCACIITPTKSKINIKQLQLSSLFIKLVGGELAT